MWAKDWQLELSVEKCNILQVGPCLVNYQYCVDHSSLPSQLQCKDLGVTITNDLSPSQHICDITIRAHRRANCILRCFATRDNDLLVRAFLVYVRPILEYNSIVWSPSLIGDIEKLEKVAYRDALPRDFVA